jgi:hypothetical protein
MIDVGLIGFGFAGRTFHFAGQLTKEPVLLAWMPAAAVYFRSPDSCPPQKHLRGQATLSSSQYS